MVLSVSRMKAPPFRCGQWPENWMVSNWLPRSETGFAAADDLIHAAKVFHDLALHLFSWSTARTDALGGFPAAGKETHPRNYQPWPAHLFAIRAGARLPGCEAALQVLDGVNVSQVQVLQNFCGAPFSWRV